MRQHGVVKSADGLVPFGHLGWAYHDRAEFRTQAAAYIADGLEQGQWIEYVGQGDRAALRAELAGMPGLAGRLDSGGIGVTPVADFYEFHAGGDLVDAPAAVARRVAATEEVLAAGYTGFRAVVDATAVARTPAQREAFARFEYLIDQKMAVLPVSALCAYDSAQIGDTAAELVCLHPFVGPDATAFQLYADPEADFALTGTVGLSDSELFARTLQRTWPLTTGDTLLVDGREWESLDDQQLLALDRYARGDGREVVLRTGRRDPLRLADRLDLTNVSVRASSGDDVEYLREQLHHRERQLDTRPVIDQVKGMLMQDFGIDDREAFDLLVALSQQTNTKLRELAERLRDELTGTASEQTRRATRDTLTALRDRLRRPTP